MAFTFALNDSAYALVLPIYNIVQDLPVIERYYICNDIEDPKTSVFHVFAPIGQFSVRRLQGSCRIENVPEPLYQFKCSLYIEILGKQYSAFSELVPRRIVG